MTLLLPTKFYIPPVPGGYVARPKLFSILDEALTRTLTLVSAPAGAGKTTLVSAWAHYTQNKGTIVGWLSVDEFDNEPARFLEYLAACMEEAGTILDTAETSIEPGEQAQLRDIVHGFILGVMGVNRDILLILDDYHHIHNQEIHAALEYIFSHAPACLHFVVLTRSDPPMELARLRMAGQLVELRMEQLRFSVAEAAAFLKKFAGITLAEADAISLTNRTEGWIAGLQLAAISLRGREDAEAFIAAFAGSHRYVFDYLLEQVLNQQAAEVREFLLKTSVLDRFCAPLCDAVIGTVDVARRSLETLERANLFLTPLDDERIWYRYHHLFGDLLKLVLEQTHPGLAAELHRRASRWYEAHGMIPDALQHALAAGDMELAARLVSANVLALVEQAELTPVLLRMDAIPRDQRQSMPWLGVAHAWALAYAGQMERVRLSLGLAEKDIGLLSDQERSRITAHIAAVRAYVAWVNGSQGEAVELAGTAANLLPVEEVTLRALNLTTLGNALTQFQANLRAVEVLEQAVDLARKVEQSHVLMLSSTALAYACIQLGRLHKAHAICQEASAAAAQYQLHTGQPLTAAACVYAELANILSEWGDSGAAIQAAYKGLALSELWGQADTIGLCLVNLIKALSLTQDIEAGQKAIQHFRKLANKVSPWFVMTAEQVEVHFWLGVNDISQAARAVRESAWKLPVYLEARLLVKQKQFDKALLLLNHALAEERQMSSLDTVRLGAIQSLAFYLKKDQAQALAVLKKTLERAEIENHMAPFISEGEPMENLLSLAKTKSFSPNFTRRVLVAFDAHRQQKACPEAEQLIEPLSGREVEILKLLNGPLSTPEIASQLTVSVNTVRTHIKNIYGKLGMHGRSGAVRRAKELGLLR